VGTPLEVFTLLSGIWLRCIIREEWPWWLGELLVMVKVHHFIIWNMNKGDWETPPSKRSAKNIMELKGRIIPDTAEDIPSNMLDHEGRFFPVGSALIRPVAKIRQKYPTNTIDEKLDEALRQSFPASDPVAVGQCSHMVKIWRRFPDR
jgi:hypothetical protein